MFNVEFRGWVPRITRDIPMEKEAPAAIDPDTYVKRSRRPSWQRSPSRTEAVLWIGGTALALLVELSAISTLPTPGIHKNFASHLGLFNPGVTK